MSAELLAPSRRDPSAHPAPPRPDRLEPARRVQGQLDAELDETGHRQAAAVAAAIAALAPVALWSSDSVRARETAAYVAKETGLDPTYDARLREYFLAERQGLTHDEYAALAPEEFAEFRRGNFDVVPGGETAEEVSGRMVAAAAASCWPRSARARLAVAVSHGAAIRDAVPGPARLAASTERAALHGLDNCAWVELDQAEAGRARCGWWPTTGSAAPDRTPISHRGGPLASIPRVVTRSSGKQWGCGAAGSAPAWHAGGQGFESPQLHSSKDEADLKVRLVLSISGGRASTIESFLTHSRKRARLRSVTPTSDFEQLLRGAGLRVTRPRVAVLGAVHEHAARRHGVDPRRRTPRSPGRVAPGRLRLPAHADGRRSRAPHPAVRARSRATSRGSTTTTTTWCAAPAAPSPTSTAPSATPRA